MTMTQVTRYEYRDHPPGHQGILAGLRACGARIKEDRFHEDVLSWAGEVLHQAGGPAGDRARAEALFRAWQSGYVYAKDPRGTERMVRAHLMLGDGKEKKPKFRAGDCFAQGTLLLRDDHALVPVEHIEFGQRIWGLNGWTRVLGRTDKGSLPVDVVTLNNGSQLRLTAEHNINVMACARHDARLEPGSKSAPCACPMSERVMQTVKVRDLRPGMVLPSPDRIPYGQDSSLAPERAYVEGLYLSDGWSETNRFSISGKDGGPKEAQKREVDDICAKLGIKTWWHEKHIRVNDPDWTARLQTMGTHAPQKHMLTLDLAEPQAAEYLRGIMADSGKNTHGEGRTFTTTSRMLAVQTRLLLKMQGKAAGWSHIEDHGGLGKNPIWRLTTRGGRDGYQEKLLRVREVLPSVEEMPCWDIQTEDAMVYLPEHDVTVHNCDDAVIGYGAACEAVGIQVLVVGASYAQDRQISHVLLLVATGPDEWTYADPSAKGYTFGQGKTPTREVVVDPMTGEVLCDDTICSSRLRGKRPPLPPDQDGKFLMLHTEVIDTVGTEVRARGPMRLVRGELGDVTAEGPVGALNENDRAYVREVIDRLAEAEAGLESMAKRAQNALKILGAPPLESVNNAMFGQTEWQRAIDVKTMLQVGRDALQEVLSGQRTLGITEGGIFGPDLVVLPLPTDVYYVGFDMVTKRPQLYERATSEPAHPSNTLGNPYLLAGGAIVAVITFAITSLLKAEAEAKTEQARIAAEQAAKKEEYDLIKSGQGDDLGRVYEARKELEQAKASGTPGGQTANAAKAVGDSAVKVVASLAAGAALAVGIQKLIQYQRGRR